MTTLDEPETLPRWSTADVHESVEARSFRMAMEARRADADRLVALFDELDVRAAEPRSPSADDGERADRAIAAYNRAVEELEVLDAYVYAIVATDSRDEQAQSLLSEIETIEATIRPLLARLADWVDALDPEALAEVSDELVAGHFAPLGERDLVFD